MEYFLVATSARSMRAVLLVMLLVKRSSAVEGSTKSKNSGAAKLHMPNYLHVGIESANTWAHT